MTATTEGKQKTADYLREIGLTDNQIQDVMDVMRRKLREAYQLGRHEGWVRGACGQEERDNFSLC